MATLTLPRRVTVIQPTTGMSDWALFSSGAGNLTVTYSDEVLRSGGNAAVVARAYHNSIPSVAGATQIGTQAVITTASTAPVPYTVSLSGVPPGDYVAGFVGANTGGNLIDVDMATADDAVWCQYGSSVAFGQPTAILITLDFVIALAGTFGLPFLLPFLIPAVGLQLDIANICGFPRPTIPQLTDLSKWTAGDAINFLQAAIWNTFCTCNAGGGGPAPITPPGVTPAPPPGGAFAVPPLACDDTSLCEILGNIALMLGSLQQQMAIVQPDVRLIQRQGVPFGYVPGPIHSALTGQGDFAVADILGLAVTFTTLPSTYPPLAGDPLTYHQIGKVSVGTADGWERSWQPTHSPYMILPVSGAVTKVGYTFPVGIVATITELLREP
jgi:hypothetical protein